MLLDAENKAEKHLNDDRKENECNKIVVSGADPQTELHKISEGDCNNIKKSHFLLSFVIIFVVPLLVFGNRVIAAL